MVELPSFTNGIFCYGALQEYYGYYSNPYKMFFLFRNYLY